MRILFVNEYFYPFDVGGAEWSTYWQASQMDSKECEIFVLTPNYGTQKEELIDGIKIFRFPFIKISRIPMRPFFQQNILWYFWSGFWIAWYSKKLKIDVVHAHNKLSVPGSIIARFLTGVPVIASIRDYSPLCSHGFCLWEKEKIHHLKEFFFKEIPFYLKNYLSGRGWIIKFAHIISATVSLWQNSGLRFFIRKSNHLVYVSEYLRKIYQQNGFDKISNSVIYNLPPNKIKPEPELVQQINKTWKSKKGKNKIVLFVGKASIGKGALSFLKTANNVLSSDNNVIYVFAGHNYIDRPTVNSLVQAEFLKNIVFLGKINQQQLAAWYNAADLIVIPSVWPEPFGRVAVEAIQMGKPIIASQKGGLTEILEQYPYGILIETSNIELFSENIKMTLGRRLTSKPQRVLLNNKLSPHYIVNQWEKIYKRYE